MPGTSSACCKIASGARALIRAPATRWRRDKDSPINCDEIHRGVGRIVSAAGNNPAIRIEAVWLGSWQLPGVSRVMISELFSLSNNFSHGLTLTE